MHRLKILVVDDDCNISNMVKMFLERIARYRVEVINDSSLAIARALTFRPDAILLDVEMPGMDGSELAAEMRANPLLQHIPTMFLTGLVPQHAGAGHEAISGGERFLAGPLSPRALVDALTRLLSAPR